MSERERRERDERRDQHYRRRSQSRSRSRDGRDSVRDRSRSPRRNRDRSPHSTKRRTERRRDSRSRSGSRSRSRSRSRNKHSSKRHRRRSTSPPPSETHHHRSKRKDKHRDRSRSRERADKKSKKREKKHKKDKEEQKGSSTAQWGKYGIINESNMFDKQAEFHTWLIEERMVNPETITKEMTKKEFARYMEDYNTATLPHEKYYNMLVFEQRMSHVRNGETITIPDEGYNVNADFAAHHSAHKAGPSSSKDVALSKEQVQELRRVQNERMQIGRMKLLGMDIKQNFGVRMDEAMQEDL